MHLLTLPTTNLRVSSLCFGTADFGAGVLEELSFQLLDQFMEAGGNFLDTAAIYADWTPAGKGSSEKLLGRWLRSRGNRAEVVLATKGGHPELSSMAMSRLAASDVAADLDASLNNLGVDTIDLYYLHRDDPSRPVEEILTYLQAFVEAGKIRYYALSNWHRDRAEAARLAAPAVHAHGFVATQLMWSLAEPDMSRVDGTLADVDEAYESWHTQYHLPAIPYSSQAGGYFNKLAADPHGPLSPVYDSPVNRLRARVISQIQETTGLNITQIALGYLMSRPFPVIPIIGCKNASQLADSLTAADVILDPAYVEALQTATPLE